MNAKGHENRKQMGMWKAVGVERAAGSWDISELQMRSWRSRAIAWKKNHKGATASHVECHLNVGVG